MAERASYPAGMGYNAINFAVAGAIGVVSSVLVARVYGVKAIGEFALAYAPALVVSTLSSAREQVGLVRELAILPSRARRITGLFAAVMTFSLLLTIVVAVLVLVGAYFVLRGPIAQPQLFLPALALVGSYAVLENTSWNLDVVFTGFRAGRELLWIRLVQALGYLAFAMAFALALDGVWGLALAWIAAAALTLLQRLFLVRRFMRFRVSREDLRDGFETLPSMVRFGVKVTPGAIADGVSNEVGTWVLGIVSSVSAVGAFNRAWLLGRRFIEVQHRVAELLFPTLVERRHLGDMEGVDRVVVDSIRYAAVLLLLPAATGGGAALGVMDLYGPGFERAGTALALLLVVPALAVIGSVQGLMLLAADRPLITSGTSVGRMALTVAACVLLSIWLGVTGAALAILVGYVAELAWKAYLVRGFVRQPPPARWRARQVAAVVSAYAAGFFVARVIDRAVEGAGGLALALALGALAYAAVFVGMGGLVERDRARLSMVRTAIRARRRGGSLAHASRGGTS